MGSIVLAILALVVVCAGVAAYLSYRKHSHMARARSRAALNRLLAEADEIEQQARRERAEPSGEEQP
jgi:hypothetical protein